MRTILTAALLCLASACAPASQDAPDQAPAEGSGAAPEAIQAEAETAEAEAAPAEGSAEAQAGDATEPSACAVEGAWRGYPPVAEPASEGTTAQPERTDLDAQTLRLEAGGRMFLEHANYKIRGSWAPGEGRVITLRDSITLGDARCSADAEGRYIAATTDDCGVLSLMVDEDPCEARAARLHTAIFRGL